MRPCSRAASSPARVRSRISSRSIWGQTRHNVKKEAPGAFSVLTERSTSLPHPLYVHFGRRHHFRSVLSQLGLQPRKDEGDQKFRELRRSDEIIDFRDVALEIFNPMILINLISFWSVFVYNAETIRAELLKLENTEMINAVELWLKQSQKQHKPN